MEPDTGIRGNGLQPRYFEPGNVNAQTAGNRCSGNGGKYRAEPVIDPENRKSRSGGEYVGDRNPAGDFVRDGSERVSVWKKRENRDVEDWDPHLSQRERVVKLGIVVQRYGDGIIGGAEKLSRLLAERFAP